MIPTSRWRWLMIVGLISLLLSAEGPAVMAVPYRNLGNRPLLALAGGHVPLSAELSAAKQYLAQSVARDPHDRATYRSVALINTLQHDFIGAESSFLASLEAPFPAHVTTTWLLLAAIRQLQQQDYDSAARLHVLISGLTAERPGPRLSCDSKALDVPIGLAWRWSRDGDKRASEAAYRLAIASAPGCPAFYYWLGSFLHEERRFAEAVTAYQQGLALDAAMQAEGYAGLGRAYLELGRLDDLTAAANSALQNGGWEWPQYLLGRAYQLKGDLQSAEAHYRQAINPPGALPASDWATWFSYFYLAWIVFDRGDFETAAEYLRAAALVMPQTTAEPQAIKYVGDVYYRQGMWYEAIREYQRALALAPQGWPWAAVIYNALGDAYRDNGQKEAAGYAYREVLGRLPDDAHANQELTKLGKDQ